MLFRCVDRSYAVGPDGVFHVDCQAPGAPLQRVLRHWDAATGQDQAVGTFESDWIGGLSASPDGRSVIYGRTTPTQDLMMIENFR